MGDKEPSELVTLDVERLRLAVSKKRHVWTGKSLSAQTVKHVLSLLKRIVKWAADTMLRGTRHREDMTQVQPAAATGIPRRHISEMENGKRPIGRQSARKLAEVLNVDPRRFLSV